MDTTTISAIIEAAKAQPPELQARWIAERTIAAVRAADAAISDSDMESEYRNWYQREYGRDPAAIATAWGVGWGRHLLSGGRHASPPLPRPGPCPDPQGRWIAEQAIASTYRGADAGISDQDLAADFRLLYQELFGSPPSGQSIELAITWARHLLSGGRHG